MYDEVQKTWDSRSGGEINGWSVDIGFRLNLGGMMQLLL
jgi:hypothetical protein